jgi:hypothetical protein
MIESIWVRTEEQSAAYQADGWRPSKGGHLTHHASYGMMLVRDIPDEMNSEDQTPHEVAP